jgi:hypothetical protein
MTIKASTALRNKLLDTAPLRTVFNLGQINIYAGAVPASGDDATGSSPILIVKNGATGLTFEAAAVNGALPKKSTETWNGVASATLTATYFRLVAPGDDNTASQTQPRLQGSVAQSGADLNLTTIALQSGTTYPVDSFSVTLPTF